MTKPMHHFFILLAFTLASVYTSLATSLLVGMGEVAQWSASIRPLGETQSDQDPVPPASPVGQESGSQPSRMATGVETVKSKRFMRRITKWNNGTQTEWWWAGPYCFLKEPHSQFVFIVMWQSGVPAGLRVQFSPIDFPELAWLDPKYLIETKETEQGTVELYGLPQNSPLVLEAAAAQKQLIDQAKQAGQDISLVLPTPLVGSSRKEFARLAWVNKTTRRPIAYEGEGLRWEYSFSTTPAEELIFPEDYKQALVDYLQMANVQEGNEMKMPKIP